MISSAAFYFGVLPPLKYACRACSRRNGLLQNLIRQRMRIGALAVIVFWIAYTLVRFAVKYQPMISCNYKLLRLLQRRSFFVHGLHQ